MFLPISPSRIERGLGIFVFLGHCYLNWDHHCCFLLCIYFEIKCIDTFEEGIFGDEEPFIAPTTNSGKEIVVAVKDCHVMLPWWKPVMEMVLRHASSTRNPTTEGLFWKV